MTLEYWDTSAILKLYILEPDSAYFVGRITRTSRPIYSSAIASVEVLSALLRKECAGDLRPGGAKALFRRFRADCAAGRVVLVPNAADVVQEAEGIAWHAYRAQPPVLIRSLDLLHIATASVLKADVVVATGRRLRELAAFLKVLLAP